MARKRKSEVTPKSESGFHRRLSFSLSTIKDACLRFRSVIALSIFVLFFGVITIGSFLQKSITVDEPMHLFAGYAYLKWGDFRANPEHPPLAKALAALPLLALDIKDPRPSTPEWDADIVANRMVFRVNDAETLFFYGKLVMISLGLLLGIFIYLWCKEIFGIEAAIAALFIYCLDPNILAHSQIVHTDMPFAFFFFIGTYLFWQAMGQITWPNLLLVSSSFGLAAITKHSFPAILPIWAILGLLKVFSSEPQECRIGGHRLVSSRWGKVALLSGILVSALIAAYLFIWAAYGFRFNAIPEEGRHLVMARVMPENPHLQAAISFITRYELFPEAWIYGQLYVLKHLRRATYLWGQISEEGFWLYFPVAFAVKTPLPALILLVAAIGTWLRRRERMLVLFLLIPVVTYFSLGVWSRINIGLRHVLPIYPFLFVLIGGAAMDLWRQGNRIARGGLIFLGTWYLGTSMIIYPHYLAYFNELVGGPKNGHKVLLDSNLDWGQDLKGLKRWMDSQGVEKIQFLYFGVWGIQAPQYYGIDAIYLPGSWTFGYSLPGENLGAASYLAISANHVAGTLLRGREREFVKPLQTIEPMTAVGYSILIYRLDKVIPHYRRVAEMNPASAEIPYYLAILLSNQGRVDEAVDHYRRAIRVDPSFADAHRALAYLLAGRGDLEGAIQHFRKALDLGLAGDESHIHFNLGNLLARQGHLDEAIEHFERALQIKPDFAQAHGGLGRVLAAKGDLERAIAQFRQALHIQPEFAEAHEDLGLALAQQGKRDEAARHIEEALRIWKARRKAQEAR